MDVWLTPEVLAIFVIFWPILAKIIAMATPLRPLQSEMSYLNWSTPKTIPYRTINFVNSCYTSEVMSIRRFATSLALPK